MHADNQLAIIILAAGTSSRLGHPKQLLQFKGESLIQNSVKKALEISNHVFVVLGHENKACTKELEGLNVTLLYNDEYKKGMGSSLSFGIQHTLKFDNTMVMLCDQPFIPIEHYQSMKDLLLDNKIVATSCKNKAMVPAIFPNVYYSQLLQLNADKGARDLLKNEICLLVPIDVQMNIDIDTNEDIKKFLYLQK